ncbi:sialic acid TRAP transporter substrate-binding protein SiaP [Thermotoga sp. KOL6]|uniref:sialic acid TRAP transporter substrate-binding protein SiaP n=1 Tax=Thermotoga sp. KOL6 TaxID=126741 RepID=UPI000C76A1C3|nr:sialic acid TRAP transporter substrate-binding protein SiaP [Thermotoga sp. KOL6]PLV59050.1 TRAP dicarboxylate transporter subunit DctP [Thermotoga sp. KOL6]
MRGWRILLVVLLSLTVIAWSEVKPDYVIRFSTVAAPTQPQVLAMQKFAEIVEELSGGKIKVEVYHSGQLGDQRTELLAVMRGDLEMCSDSAPSWFADLAAMPEFGVFEAAYAFRDLDHMYRVMTSQMVQELFDKLAKKTNLRVLDVWYLGTRELNFIERVGPVRKPEDLKGVKLRMPNNKTFLHMARALGANPTPMSFTEVYLALKTGAVDGQDNPLPTDYSAKFCEVTHYIVLTDHQIGMICPVINEKLWQSMPEEYRNYIKRAIQVARYYMNYTVLEQEAKLLKLFREQYGMEIIVPDKEAFIKHAHEYYLNNPAFDEKWKELYRKIQEM